MGFKKIRLGIEEIFDTKVLDTDGRELARWKVLKRDYPDTIRILSKKFGINIKVIDLNKKDKDLDWAMK